MQHMHLDHLFVALKIAIVIRAKLGEKLILILCVHSSPFKLASSLIFLCISWCSVQVKVCIISASTEQCGIYFFLSLWI